jgi:reactive intermediate/imine deaminase
MRKIIATPHAPAAIGPYIQGVDLGYQVMTSGQIPVCPQTGKIADNVADQARQSLENVKAIVTAAGLEVGSIVKTTVFITDLNDFATINQVYQHFFDEHQATYPTRSCVQVARLPKDVKLKLRPSRYATSEAAAAGQACFCPAAQHRWLLLSTQRQPEDGDMISAFDIFKPGIGPSSSHTVGPMNAGKRFIDQLVNMGDIAHITRIVVDLYGSLSLTGKGHATDVAIVMGLAGNSPQNVDIDAMPAFIQQVMHSGRLPVANGVQSVDFQMADDIVFHAQTLPYHENGMRITAWSGAQAWASQTYYSVGGGFIVEEGACGGTQDADVPVPYDFRSASELLRLCERNGLSVSGLMLQNELALRSKAEIDAGFMHIHAVMRDGIERGMNTEGCCPVR